MFWLHDNWQILIDIHDKNKIRDWNNITKFIKVLEKHLLQANTVTLSWRMKPLHTSLKLGENDFYAHICYGCSLKYHTEINFLCLVWLVLGCVLPDSGLTSRRRFTPFLALNKECSETS